MHIFIYFLLPAVAVIAVKAPFKTIAKLTRFSAKISQ